jgi:hypothetical protein
LRTIREFSEEQRRATREALMSGIARGVNPRQQAIEFRQSIGLTQNQQQAVENYRRLLTEGRQNNLPSETALRRNLRDARFDRSIIRAIRDNRPLTEDQVNRMVSRYRERYIRYRSETIARTEALRAVHSGSEEMYQQAIEMGQIRPDQIRRTWNTAQDERVRGAHAQLHGEVRGIDGVWTNSLGELRFPGDPLGTPANVINCRCAISTRIVG